MATPLVRTVALTGLAFLAAHAWAVHLRVAEAACNDKCKDVKYGRYCAAGSTKEIYVEYTKAECGMCSNSKDTWCDDAVNVPCAPFGTGMNNSFRTSAKGTPVCPCNPGVARTDASAIENPPPTWIPCGWLTCVKRPS